MTPESILPVEIHEAKIIFGRQQGTKTVQFRGTPAEILDAVRAGVDVNMRGREAHTNHIYGGKEYGSNVTKFKATFRDRVPELLRKTEFIGSGAVRYLLMKALCDQVITQAVSLASLEKVTVEVTSPEGAVMRLDGSALVGGDVIEHAAIEG